LKISIIFSFSFPEKRATAAPLYVRHRALNTRNNRDVKTKDMKKSPNCILLLKYTPEHLNLSRKEFRSPLGPMPRSYYNSPDLEDSQYAKIEADDRNKRS
jgi:hypothetical protein